MSGTNHNYAAQAQLNTNFCSSFFLTLSSELVCSPADVVNASQIDVKREWLFSHLYEIFFIEAFYAVNEANQLQIFPLSLES